MSIAAAIARSQGQRSSSVNGIPACILAMFSGGWNASPSSRVQPTRFANSLAIVVFPLPDTPITTTTVIGLPFRPVRSRSPVLRRLDVTAEAEPHGREDLLGEGV